MRTVHCVQCLSDDVEFKVDILVGCCHHKTGEVWQCNQCGQEMLIQVVFSDQDENVYCPHQNDKDHHCGGCGK